MLLPGHPGRSCALPSRVTRARPERFFRLRDVIRVRRQSRDPPRSSAPTGSLHHPGPTPVPARNAPVALRSCRPTSRRREPSPPSPGPLLIPLQPPPNRRSVGTAPGRSPEQSTKRVRTHLQLYWRRYRARSRPGAAGRDPGTGPQHGPAALGRLLHTRPGLVAALLGPLSHLPPLALQPKGQSRVTARGRADSPGAAAVPGSSRGPAGSAHTLPAHSLLAPLRREKSSG